MQTALNYLNETHCIAKVGKVWRVCQLTSQSIFTLDGQRVCSRKEKVRWKRFFEAMFYSPEEGVVLQVDDIVLINDDHGVPCTFRVVDTGLNRETGKTAYIVGR